jgi:hypothetical protein
VRGFLHDRPTLWVRGLQAEYQAVASRSVAAIVAAAAAKIAAEHELHDLEKDLEEAFSRFLDDPVKTDPGCRAKLAAAESLRNLDVRAPDVYPWSHVQAARAELWRIARHGRVRRAKGLRSKGPPSRKRSVLGSAETGIADQPEQRSVLGSQQLGSAGQRGNARFIRARDRTARQWCGDDVERRADHETVIRG